MNSIGYQCDGCGMFGVVNVDDGEDAYSVVQKIRDSHAKGNDCRDGHLVRAVLPETKEG